MRIQHNEQDGKGMFYVEDHSDTVAELVYSTPSPDKMIIEHTEVDDSLSGKGLGTELVQAAVEYARANNVKIIPLCSFAKSVLEHEREWQDVLDKQKQF